MGARILIVDDQAIMLRLIGIPLEAEGYTLITAMTGAEALMKIQSDPPDLVILDVMLPDASGIDVLHRIRQGLKLVDLPVIILSGQTELDAKIKGLEAGADEYVTKPVDPKEMSARVRALLARTQRIRQMTAQSVPTLRHGKTLAVIGAKGGVGTTTVALNMALALSIRGRRTAVVELRPYFGTFTRQLGLKSTANLNELLEMKASHINERQVAMRLTAYANNLQVLPGPRQLKEYREIQPDQVEALLVALNQMCEFTVVDLPHMPSVANRAALRAAQSVLVVVEPEASAIAAAHALFELLRAWGIGGAIIRLVLVNRTPTAHSVPISDIERELGSEILGVVTAAPDLAAQSAATGRPMVLAAPDALASNTLFELGDKIAQLVRQSPAV